MAGKITIFMDINFGGKSFDVTTSTGDLTGDQHRSASSLKISGFEDSDWNAFFETVENEDDDVLWVQGNGELQNLHTVRRPHGNNHWGDRISQIKVNLFGGPDNRRENQTIISHGSRKYVDGNNPQRQLDETNPTWGT